MSSNVSKALGNLNQATGDRQYDIKQDGGNYVLLMPGGMGEYPGRDELAMRQLLMNLTNSAGGRSK